MKILDFPSMRQTYNFDCGAKAVEALLAFYGIDAREDNLMKLLGTNKSGTPIHGILKAAKQYGFDAKAKEMTIDEIKESIDNNDPVILILQAWTNKKNIDWENDWIDGHYVVAVGYDKHRLYFEDPSSILRTYLTYDELMTRWHDIVHPDGKKYYQYGIVFHGNRKAYKENTTLHMD